MVGWGVFAMPGNSFLPIAGPAGTVIAMVLSTAIILVIARNFAYLMNRFPGTGGVYTYTREAFGRDHAFLSSWFLSLSYLTIVFLNATALFYVSRTMLGSVLQVGLHYQIAGYDVYLGEIALSATALAVTGVMFVLGKSVLQKLQTILAVILFAGIVVITLAALPHLDVAAACEFSDGSGIGITGSILALVLLAPWAFVGFDIASLETAHFRFPITKSWRILVVSIVCAGFAYGIMVLVGISCIPESYGSWQEYVADLENLKGIISVPPFFAANATMGNVGIAVIVVTALAAILTGIIGAARATTRMLSTMAEDRILSKGFLRTTYCIVFIMGFSILISFLGRNALNWFVELTSFGAIVGFGYVSAAACKLAHRDGDRPIVVTGIVGTVIAVAFALMQLLSRFASIETMSAPSFLLLALWCLLGFVFYWRTMRQGNLAQFKGISVSGTVLFSLLFYCVLLWFSKSLVQATGDLGLQTMVIRNSIVLVVFVGVGLAGMLYIQRMLRDRHDQLEREVMRAEEGSKAKSQFLFNMSHDIRTPMNAIMGYTRLAEMEPDIPPKVDEYIRKINVSGKHLLELIDDILEMSRIESGKIDLELVSCDLHEVLDDARSIFADQMAEKGITFTVDGSQLGEGHVLCDRKRFDRVVQNLLSNACKFTSEGGNVSVTFWQIANAAKGRASYELRVKDDGIGMAPEFAEKVFDAFERERTSTASGVTGTGLGMAITKDIVDLMGGTIEVATAPGEGTEFVVRVAFDVVGTGDAAEAAETVGASPETTIDFSTIRVLLVEDNEINQEIMTMLLASHGFKVDVASNGREAVDAIASSVPGSYDIVLMDIQMPVMDGYEATMAIRALPDPQLASVPIIAVTANAFGEDARKAFEVGMNGHIAKPVDPDKLLKTLTASLAASAP